MKHYGQVPKHELSEFLGFALVEVEPLFQKGDLVLQVFDHLFVVVQFHLLVGQVLDIVFPIILLFIEHGGFLDEVFYLEEVLGLPVRTGLDLVLVVPLDFQKRLELILVLLPHFPELLHVFVLQNGHGLVGYVD